MDTPLRLAEFVATLALAQDNAFGQPLESQLRSCLLASWMCDAADYGPEVSETAYWVALLRYIGCTGHAHEVATLFGDEIAIRSRTLVHDAANPTEVMHDVVDYATAWRPAEERDAIIAMIQQTAHQWAVHNFASGCEVADMLVQRLDFGPGVREALACTFERWNGNGFPTHAAGEAIPLPMRIVHVSHDMEAIGRLFSPEQAIETVRERRDRTYDPALSDLFAEHGQRMVRPPRRARPLGRRPGARARTAPDAGGRGARPGSQRRGRLHRPEVALHGRAQPPLRADRRRRGQPARALRRRDRADPPLGARPRLRHHRGAQLDLGQGRRADPHGVRSRRAPPDADRADAAALAGPRGAQSHRRGAPREVRRIRLPPARHEPTPAIWRPACWRRRRSTSG